MSYIAHKYALGGGVGTSGNRLPSFDKALLEAGVGNYNLVRLSSILPAYTTEIPIKEISKHIQEGSLLPTAYSTISSDKLGTKIASAIGLGLPKDKSRVGVIMEFSAEGLNSADAVAVVRSMVEEAFSVRGWELDEIKTVSAEATVAFPGVQYTTFACLCEW